MNATINSEKERWDDKGCHGRQHNQKMKPYLVWQYLLKNTDKKHPKKADDVATYLEQDCGIYAERRSIYRDIEEINKAFIMLGQGCTAEEAEEILEEDEYNEEKVILKCKQGFYARPINYTANDIRLLAECIYSAKFLEKSQADFLVELVCGYVNEFQAKTIKHDVLLTDRVRTNNAEVINSIDEINKAISKKLNGEKHLPEKISFKYLKYTISDIKSQVERRKGDVYVVSPYALIINDGYYYLLAFDEKKKMFTNYRVDRMKDVNRTGEPRDGEREFLDIDLKSYMQRVFNMYSGDERRITMRFINPLLDTVVDRLGTKGVQYSKSDERQFNVSANLEVSPQFFGWLLGFGKRAKIIAPDDVVEKFKEYVDSVRGMYEDKEV